jgi:hypothetical protein
MTYIVTISGSPVATYDTGIEALEHAEHLRRKLPLLQPVAVTVTGERANTRRRETGHA